MKKKFICTVCGYIHEGPEPPEKCPVCKVPASKFKEITDEEMTYATVHKIGDGKPEGVSEEMIQDLRNHFNGECGEVGMYLAMSRQADREGYPEVAEASAYGTRRPTSRSVPLLRLVPARTSSASPRTRRPPVSMPSTTPCMRWPRTRPATEQASPDC